MDGIRWCPGDSLKKQRGTGEQNSSPSTNFRSANHDYADFRLSRDDTRLSASLVDPKLSLPDVWLFDLPRGAASRLTFGPVTNANAVWAPQGDRIAFRTNRRGLTELYQMSAVESGNDEPLLPDEVARTAGAAHSNKIPTDWSTDGQRLAFTSGAPSDIWLLTIADPTAAAHEAGIVHRDLKPGNVMVTPNGTIKLLDFGLAKLVERDASHSADATRTAATLEGTIAGTVSYMSPEQAETKPLDARSDIFSFGCVLYEMLTGQRAFHGDSAMSTLSAVLTAEPKAVTQLTPGVPRDMERVTKRCLRKDPDRRFQTARDLKVALQELLEEFGSGIPAAPLAPVSKRDRRLCLGGALALSVTVAAAVWLATGTREQQSAAMVESQLTAYEGREWQPSFSSDGNQVAFVWSRDGGVSSGDIFVRLIGAGQPLPLTNTPEGEFSPAWSPDGRWIAFLRYASQNATTSLFVMPSIGGRERKVTDALTVGKVRWYPELMVATVRWSPDGKWLLVSGTVEKGETVGLLLIDFATGERRRLTRAPAEAWDVGGSFSPDGRQIGFLRQHSGNSQGDIYLLDVDASLRAASEPRRLTTDGFQLGPPVWTVDGREVVFQSVRGGRSGLWRARMAGGTPVRVLGQEPLRGSRQFAAAAWRMCSRSRIQIFGRSLLPGLATLYGSSLRR